MQEYEGIFYLELEDALTYYMAATDCDLNDARVCLIAPDKLEGALGRPAHYRYYGGADMAVQAAALIAGITQDHPFIDGNKRTAALCCLAFFNVNGRDLKVHSRELAPWISGLATKTLTIEDVGDLLRAVLA